MQNLIMPAQMGEFYTPYVNFDLDTKIFEVGGESFLEDTDEQEIKKRFIVLIKYIV